MKREREREKKSSDCFLHDLYAFIELFHVSASRHRNCFCITQEKKVVGNKRIKILSTSTPSVELDYQTVLLLLAILIHQQLKRSSARGIHSLNSFQATFKTI